MLKSMWWQNVSQGIHCRCNSKYEDNWNLDNPFTEEKDEENESRFISSKQSSPLYIKIIKQILQSPNVKKIYKEHISRRPEQFWTEQNSII